MSKSLSIDSKLRESIDSAKPHVACRIPLRSKGPSRLKNEALTRRPKSGDSRVEETITRPVRGLSCNKSMLPAAITQKRPSTEKSGKNDTELVYNDGAELTLVPTSQNENSFQINQYDDLNQSDVSPHTEVPATKCESVSKLKQGLEEQTVQFEKLKDELSVKQRAIIELYASMRTAQNKLTALGQNVVLPPTDELSVMNLARVPPERLLELCTDTDMSCAQTKRTGSALSGAFTVDTMKLYNIPMKLLAACEQTINRRKELTEWLDSFMTSENEAYLDIDVKKIVTKINEFNSDSEILKRTLDNVKENFFKDIYEITDILRNTVNDASTLRIRIEELSREISETNAQNTALKKQLHNVDHQKIQFSKNKIEELERTLKEEKQKKLALRDRLARFETQTKLETERIAHMNSMIEQQKTQKYNLERMIQELRDQNQNLRAVQDSEINKLSVIIENERQHLEEVTASGDKLRHEKESLEKSLKELEENHKKTLETLKNDMVAIEIKLKETDAKCLELVDKNTKLELNLKELGDQLLEAEHRNENLTKSLKEQNVELSCKEDLEKEIDTLRKDLEVSNKEIEAYKNMLKQKADTIAEFVQKNHELHVVQSSLKREIYKKDKNISDLETNNSIAEQQLQEHSKKLDFYESKINSFQNKFSELFDRKGEPKDLEELHKKILEQKLKLQEAMAKIQELTEALRNKSFEIERRTNDITTHNNLLKQKDSIIKILSDKQEEQANLIKVLQNNLEIRSHMESEYNRQVAEKNKEITILCQDLKTRKEQVQELENIILTLEDQVRKLEMQKRSDREKIMSLERKIVEYEMYRAEVKHRVEPPVDLDNLIKILEDELESSFESKIINNEERIKTPRKCMDRVNKLENFECHENNDSVVHKSNEAYSSKIIMGNFIGKPHIDSKNDEFLKAEKLDRKQAITNIETQNSEPATNIFKSCHHQVDDKHKDNCKISLGTQNDRRHTQQNVYSVHPSYTKEEKKHKVFKTVEV